MKGSSVGGIINAYMACLFVESNGNKDFNGYVERMIEIAKKEKTRLCLQENKNEANECIKKWLSRCGKVEWYRKTQGQFKNARKSLGADYYKTNHWIIKREAVKQRDGFKCVECGSKDNLHVHHIKYLHKSNHIKNLQTLCKYCHAKKHPINGVKILS